MKEKSTRVLTLVIIIQSLMVVSQWLSSSNPAIANAQVPDAGAQRVQVIDQLREMNGKLDRLTTLLESGKLQVRTTSSAEDKK